MFTVERTFPTVVTVKMDVTAGWDQWFLLRSDAHHDNLHADRRLEQRHLEQAKERGAGILDFGDLFCAMQGRWDKRADQSQLREELRGTLYTDKLVEEAAKFYTPFADRWILLARGNHEGSIIQRHQTDLTERLAASLRMSPEGSVVQAGTFQGWVRFCFSVNATRRYTTNLRYTHGYGGGGPVTKDTIQANRQMAFLDNADIIVSGHTHDSWHVLSESEGLNHGRPERRTIDLIKCGGYKDEYTDGHGWAVEKGMPPKPLGGWWLRFFWESGGHIGREFIRTDSPTRRGKE